MKNKYWIIILPLFLLISGCGSDDSAAVDSIPDSLMTVTNEDSRLYESLLDADPVPVDPVELSIMIRGVDPNTLQAGPSGTEQKFEVGNVRTFWVNNNDTLETLEIEAELMIVSDHAYFWQDINSDPKNGDGEPVSGDDWQVAADTFDNSYKSVNAVYGDEELPGIDGDERVYIVHSDSLGNVGGYFGEAHQLPTAIEPRSNEGQYFFISDSGAGGVAGGYYNEVLAHEYQHMIHKNQDPNEDGWLNEGLSQLAQQFAGMTGDVSVPQYLANLDESLWYWGSGSTDYAQAYLFVDYLFEQYGTDFISNLVSKSSNGFASIDELLEEVGSERNMDEVYADFILATYLNDPDLDEGQYSFTNPTVGDAKATNGFESLPATYEGTVNQYGGADVLLFEGSGDATLNFTGSQAALLIPTTPHSDTGMWWSNRADATISTLTREVDLRDVESATLTYWTWFNIEDQWDYGYVMVSADNGETWNPVQSSSSTDADPNENNYGHGLTGTSGGEKLAEWVQESVDLSQFAGGKVLLRFAMINDLGVNEHGFAIDDIEIPEIDYSDDAENDGDWTAEGFVRIHNRIPQIWSVSAAELRADGDVIIHKLDVEDSSAELPVNFDELDQLVVFIIGQTRHTTMAAPYVVEVASD